MNREKNGTTQLDTQEAPARLIALYCRNITRFRERQMVEEGFYRMDKCREAKPLFKGHYQPHVPADLGYYDLRLPETRVAQADMAGNSGSKLSATTTTGLPATLIERPFNEVLASGEPDFRFACAGRIRPGAHMAW